MTGRTFTNGVEDSPTGLNTYCQGQMKTATGTATLTTAGQYYKIAGTYAGGLLSCFTLNANGTLTYTASENVTVLFNGAANLTANKACIITFALYKNGAIVPGATSPVYITYPGKPAANAITDHIALALNDYFEIYASSDTASTTLTVPSLQITMDGHY